MGFSIPAMNTTSSRINSPSFGLIRIEVLVLFGVATLFLLLVFGSYRRRSSNEAVRLIVWAAYTLSYTLVSYTTGLMQSSPNGNSLFTVWVVCLMLILGSVDSLSAYNLHDNDSWKRFYILYLVQSFWVGWVLGQFGEHSNFKRPVWAIWAIAVMSSATRTESFEVASKYYKLSDHTKWVADYMSYEHEQQDAVVPNPLTMRGYRYVVAGEDGLKGKIEPPDYLCKYKADDTKLVTVEQIWQCNGKLLRSESQEGSLLKDICLSMALSKMLNRRFAGFDLAESKLEKTRDFVFQGLLSGDTRYERPFRVIEVELGFVHDFFYTKYYVMSESHLFHSILLPTLLIPLFLWLAYLLFGHFHTPNDTLTIGRNSRRNYYALVTMLIVLLFAIFELLQLYFNIASDWSKVYLISRYVKKPTWQSNEKLEKVFAFVVRRMKAFRHWENRIGQYSLLNKFNYRSNNVFPRVSFGGLVDKTKNGRKKGKPIGLPNEVKQAVINSLVESSGRLTNGITSLSANQVGQLLWTCTGLRTVTHTILIWHIATTLCDHTLNGEGGAGQQLSDEDADGRAEMRTHALVASSLSKYCAYLVAFQPNLLPGHSFDSETIFDALVGETSQLLEGTMSMQQKYDTLMSRGAADQEDRRLIMMGARLGKQLIDEITDPRLRWKVLHDFWAEMMLYVAPSNDARAHLETLIRGGEFITHLWALLTHAGILERDDSAGTP